MNAHVRRAAAYVAHRLISDESSDCIYDYAEGRFFKFGGSLAFPEVMVFDNDRCCYIVGKAAGGKVSLFHFGDSSNLRFEVANRSFKGFDYATQRYFSGTVQSRLIRVFDYDGYTHHTYGF